jgi:hypothetical protein
MDVDFFSDSIGYILSVGQSSSRQGNPTKEEEKETEGSNVSFAILSPPGVSDN